MKLSPSGDFMTSQAHHWLMKRLVLILPLFAGHLSVLRAEPFEQAEVKKAINVVSLLPQDVRAAPGDIVKGDTALQTGGNSRAELQFPDLTITRVGSNALFRFVAGTREMVLDSGTMLFSSPKGAGGGTVQAGAVTAAVTGSDFMISNLGRIKVICLSHKVTVYFTANPRVRVELLPGQMLDIAAGANRKMPPVTTINLGKLLATSLLKEAGGFTPLPSQAILTQNANKQGKAFSLANTSLTSESAEMVRSTTAAPDLPASQSLQTEAATTAREAAATASPPDKAGNGTSGNPGNEEKRGNRNNENRGNSGNSENRGRNNENRGNSGNRGNNSNISNIENRGNSGNNENRGNSGNNENRGNNSNIRNIENRGNSGNAPGRAGN